MRGPLRDSTLLAIARATLDWRTAATSSASANPRARTSCGSTRSTSMLCASARRNSAVRGPNASDPTACSASESASPEAPDDVDPTVALRGGRDRLVLGGELRDRAPAVLLGGDRLVRGQLGADVLEHATEHGPRGRIARVARVRPAWADSGRSTAT